MVKFLFSLAVYVSHQVMQMMCHIFGDCLKSYMFTKFSCSFCTEIDIATLKYVAKYTGINNTFDCIMQPQFSYCLICWFVWLFGWDLQNLLITHVHLACQQHITLMKLESYWLFKVVLFRFSYILVISRDYILLICSCPVNEVKVGKLPILIASFIDELSFMNNGEFINY